MSAIPGRPTHGLARQHEVTHPYRRHPARREPPSRPYAVFRTRTCSHSSAAPQLAGDVRLRHPNIDAGLTKQIKKHGIPATAHKQKEGFIRATHQRAPKPGKCQHRITTLTRCNSINNPDLPVTAFLYLSSRHCKTWLFALAYKYIVQVNNGFSCFGPAMRPCSSSANTCGNR
jgi:hypothetical protein